MTADVTGPHELFERWSDAQVTLWIEARGSSGFSPETVAVYRSIWNLWLRWLAGQSPQDFADPQARWHGAAPRHVEAFTTHSVKDRRHRKTAGGKGDLAGFTRQRYWSVLNDIYAFAALLGFTAANPAAGIQQPRVVERDRTFQALPPGVLQMLRDPRQLARLLPQEGTGWWVLRDRAAMALLAHCGLAARELIALQGRSLRRGATMLQVELQGELLPYAPTPAYVDLPSREIALPAAALQVLEPWLTCREELLRVQRRAAQGRARATRQGPDPASLEPDALQPLLLSRETVGGIRHTALHPSSLNVLVQRCLLRAYAQREVKMLLGDGSRVQTGPAIIRNTVIGLWAQTKKPEEAARLAGLKSTRNLRRLGEAAVSSR